MLTMPIKKKWFDMILSGEKKEEYREIKIYYIKRFANLLKIKPEYVCLNAIVDFIDGYKELGDGINVFEVMFRNGYSKDSPSFIAKCTLSVGKGKEEWGAENGKEYFVLTVKEILSA